MKNWPLYVGLSIEFILLITVLSSCMKQPDFSQKFGDEVAAETVDQAIKSIDQPSPYTIRKGEFAYMERSTQIETLPPTVVLQKADTVIDKCQDPERFLFTMVSKTSEYVDGHMGEPTSKEWTATLEKEKSQAIASAMSGRSVRAMVHGNVTVKDGTEPTRVTYHNLQKYESTIPVPDLVKKRPDCGGLTPEQCQAPLPVTKLSFDKVEWTGDTGEKTTFLFVFSQHVPYFGSQLMGCAETTIPYEEQRIHVTQCEQYRDFTFGHEVGEVPTCSPTPTPAP